MKIKERIAILLSIAVLLSACTGTGTDTSNEKTSDTDSSNEKTSDTDSSNEKTSDTDSSNEKTSDTDSSTVISSVPVEFPVKLISGVPAHPFFYILKYSVDQTQLPNTGPDTEFSFLLMHNEQSNNPFTTDTEGQVIRRKAGDLDGGNISAMMIQAGDAAERIYDAAGSGTINTTDPAKHVYSLPTFSNRPATDTAQPTDLEYSKPLRLLKPDTDYHLYVRVNNAAPHLLTSIKTAALHPVPIGNTYESSYDVAWATKNSTFTFSTRNAEPFYPSAPLFLWHEETSIFKGLSLEQIDANNQNSVLLDATLSSINPRTSAMEVTNTDFVNLRYVDAALDIGMPNPAENAWVYWFDTDATHKDWPTIRLKQEVLATSNKLNFTISAQGTYSNFVSKVLH